MELIADFWGWWGLSLPQTLLVAALILAIVDIFFQSDVATHVGYVLASIAVACWTPVHPLFRVLIGLLAWVAMVYLHYALWREVAQRLANRVIAPTRYRSGLRGLVGERAVIKEIAGNKMLSLHGDLWSYECPEDLPAGAPVRVVGQRGGVLVVEPSHTEN